MDRDTLQALVNAHNILYGITVVGDAVIPMAQVITLLRGVIEAEASKQSETTQAEAADKGGNTNE